MSENSDGRVALVVQASSYGLTLVVGLVLVLCGKTTPLEASAYVSPFLMTIQKANAAPDPKQAARRRSESQK